LHEQVRAYNPTLYELVRVYNIYIENGIGLSAFEFQTFDIRK